MASWRRWSGVRESGMPEEAPSAAALPEAALPEAALPGAASAAMTVFQTAANSSVTCRRAVNQQPRLSLTSA